MVYDIQNLWVHRLRQSSSILSNYKAIFHKPDLFPCPGKGTEYTYSVGAVREG